MNYTINPKETQFFIAIAKQDVHTFIMIGTYKGNKVQQLLCRVGKYILLGDKSRCTRLTQVLFTQVDGQLQDEGLRRRKKDHTPISYKAFDLTLDQYIEFIQILEALQTPTNNYNCYKPHKISPDELVFSQKKEKIYTPIDPGPSIRKATNFVDINNNCRHGAIALIEEVLHTSVRPGVSSCFFNELSGTTFLDYGSPCESIPFYVLPIPPTACHTLSPEQRLIANKLYKRMEKVILLAPESIETQEKFASLKELYNQVMGNQKEIGINDLLESIQNWKKEHWGKVHILRETFIWDNFITRKSATAKTIEQIERELLAKNPVNKYTPMR